MLIGNFVSRKKEIETIIEIINKSEEYKENSENGLVILLNGEWGTGKSTFLSELKGRIEEEREMELFNDYNSYEYDCYDNAYIPFFASISDKIEIDEKFSNFIKSIGIGAASGIQAITTTVFKSIIKNLTKIDLNEVGEELERILNMVEDDYLLNFKEFKKNKEYIKEKLNEKCKNKKQIFIVDELDRCKPHFAMETLEIIKHFFDVKNCIFIISVDKIQLEESAKSIYGNINSEKYFSKLFDYQFNLLPIDFYDTIYSYTEEQEELKRQASKIFDCLNISIRDSKKIFNELTNNNKNWTIYQSSFMLFLYILKYTDLSFYNAFLNHDYIKYKKLFDEKYNVNLEKYKKILRTKIGNGLTYGEILDEVNYCLDQSLFDLNQGDKRVSVSLPNGKYKEKEMIIEDVKIYVPIIKYNEKIKDNIKKIIC